jgi:hypothetical protein
MWDCHSGESRLDSSRLDGVTFQKVAFFMVAAMWTSLRKAGWSIIEGRSEVPAWNNVRRWALVHATYERRGIMPKCFWWLVVLGDAENCSAVQDWMVGWEVNEDSKGFRRKRSLSNPAANVELQRRARKTTKILRLGCMLTKVRTEHFPKIRLSGLWSFVSRVWSPAHHAIVTAAFTKSDITKPYSPAALY